MFEVSEKDGVYAIKGRLDENADMTQLPLDLDVLKVSFKYLKQMNSFGIKKWIAHTTKLSGKLHLLECPSFIVEQIIMLPEFRNNAQIESIFLPFFCRKCALEYDQLIVFNDEKQLAEGLLEELTNRYHCDTCSKPLEFDDDIETFKKIFSEFPKKN